MINKRGTFPSYVITGITSDRTGLLTGSVEKHFTLAEFTIAAMSAAPDPGWGIPCVGSSASVPKNGTIIVTYSFEGVSSSSTSGGNGGGTPGDDSELIVVSLEGADNEEPIETHPNFEKIAKIYLYDESEGKFARYLIGDDAALPGPKKGGIFGVGDALASLTVKNPLYGVEAFLTPGVVFRRSYSVTSVPSDVYQGIGSIIERPPSIERVNYSREGKRNWLKLAPRVSSRGNAYTVEEAYLLSGKAGWNKDIYAK